MYFIEKQLLVLLFVCECVSIEFYRFIYLCVYVYIYIRKYHYFLNDI